MQENNKAQIILTVFLGLIVLGIFLAYNHSQLKPKNTDFSTLPGQGNVSAQNNFNAQNKPIIDFPSVAYAENLQKNTTIYNSKGQVVEATMSIVKSGNGTKIEINKPQRFTPGKYSLVINENGRKITQNFTWGVLAINPNKSVFAPGETADLSIAVLDENGSMVCDADVSLDIKDPTGRLITASVKNKLLVVNPECKQKNYTVNPDYEAKYKVQQTGTYEMKLTATTKNGTYSIVDYFSVKSDVPFDVERITATRIYPYSSYPVLIKITAKKDFSGVITENVPDDFNISTFDKTLPYSNITSKDKVQYINWNVNIKKNQQIKLGYYFKAPLISPQFFLLGPLSLLSNNIEQFKEQRAWQLAIDATYQATVLADSPLGYWRFGESAGTSATDLGSGVHNGTYRNSPSLGQTGLLSGDAGTSVRFTSASNQDVRIVTTTYPALADSFSIEFWFKPNDLTNEQRIFTESGGTGTPSVEFGVTDKRIRVGCFNIASSLLAENSTDLVAGTPYHIVWTKNGATNHLYVNGVDDIGSVSNCTAATPGGGDTYWGVNPAGSGEALDGTLQEGAIYVGALSASQVLAHYNAGITAQQSSTASSCSAYSEGVQATSGLVSYWRVGESGGTTATDSKGSNDGTYTGGFTLGQPGFLIGDSNTAVKLNGSSGFINIPDAGSLDLGDGPLSMELWFKRTNTTAGEQVFFNKGANTYGLTIGSHANGRLAFAKIGVAILVDSTVDVLDTNWHHFIGTKNGAAIKLYLDGQDVTGSISNATLADTANPLQIGQDVGGGGFVNATIDEIAVYNQVLSASQALSHYNTGISSSCGNFRFQGLRMQGLRIN